jgi:uncharacterized protein (TIGR02145 family)
MKNLIRISGVILITLIILSCKKDEPTTIPHLSTSSITNITITTAVSGGTIASDGGAKIIEDGVCWSTSLNPSITDDKTVDRADSAKFISSLSGLTAGTTYHLRAYATNSVGTAYGVDTSFTTYNSNAITDIDGNYYNIVAIGSQVWMAENLKTTRFNDGTPIPLVTVDSVWAALFSPGYCWYANAEAAIKDTYGALYNYFVLDPANNNTICPTGWHVPTDTEWHALVLNLDPNAVLDSPESTTAGGKLKSTKHWGHLNNGSTNETGFTALPGGCRYSTGVYGLLGIIGSWWAITADSPSDRALDSGTNNVYRSKSNWQAASSVRCIKEN